MNKDKQPSGKRNLAYYCDCFANLKVYKSQKKGDALNKPILILSIIDLVTQNIIQDKCIRVSDELIDTFRKYWNIFTGDSFKGSDFALPFFHLKNDKCKFWHLKYSSEYDGGRPQTIPKLREDVDYAYLDDELFNFIQDEISRKELIDSLVLAWLSSDEGDILKINQNFQSTSLETETFSENLINLEKPPKWNLKRTAIRNAFFRKAIVYVYDSRCAFCGLKVSQNINQSIVDGAHIKPFAQFYDSRIHNGIALCKNHHWAFDRGWFTIDDQYKILVSQDLVEVSPYAKPLKDFHGEKILLPNTEQYFPELDALQWHRQNIFQA
ncbi:HNH endonuclease [Nodularia spumigena]|uniref:HNH endonuclease n=1 Tax=Nodularia spumigena CENA596 TaxID=1819295 RepID=A0A166JH01_NODSP|nr:HNH endonuclease [Nodularia spumigena]KZL49702.1 HNH endonuclease [Nodularia spumigena CENA596]MDB9501127.1 HNH endonuclease [Nodularia spumigena CS-336/02]